MSTETKKKFGYWSIVLLTVNAVIGTGIFLSPAGVVKQAGTYTPLLYILAGVFASILAITFAAASKFTRKNGAAYAYAKVAFGPDLGFYVGITRFTSGAIAWGVMATAVVKTTLRIFGGSELAGNKGYVTIGFVVLMCILLGILFAGTRVTKIVSNLSTIGKMTALVVAIFAGLVIFLMTGENHFFEVNTITNAEGELMVKPMDLTIFVTALLAAFYAYTGFESVPTAASEMVEPEKNLPRALPVGVGIIAAIYVGIVTIAMVINPVEIMTTKEPVVLAAAFSNPLLKNIILYGALISMFGINVAAAFSTPRIFEAMADEGQLPAFMKKRTSNGVPVFAFIVTAALAIIIPMAFEYDVRGILIISSVARFVQFLVVPIAVIWFYKGKSAEPLLPAKRNVFTDVIIPILAFVLSAFLIVKFNWVGSFTYADGGANYFAIVAMLIGYIVLPLALYIPLKMGKFQK